MKNIYVALLVFILTLTCLFANAQNKYMPGCIFDFSEIIAELYTPADNIFFNDPENITVFVDFQSVKDRVIKIHVKRNEVIIFEEDVSHLSHQTIYELPAGIFPKGIYEVEIFTGLGFKYSYKIRTQTVTENIVAIN